MSLPEGRRVPAYPSFDLTDRVALVTGAGRGIGRDLALALAHAGARVVAGSRTVDEVDALAPEVAPALRAAGDDIERFFADVTPVAVDVAVMERSRRVLVLPGDFAWDDVGTWGALGRVRRQDPGGNALSGNAHVLDARRNVVHADGNAVVLYGVDDLVVVAGPGLTLVTTVDRSSDLKTLVESLPPALRALA